MSFCWVEKGKSLLFVVCVCGSCMQEEAHVSKIFSAFIGLVLVLAFVVPASAASPSQMTDDAGRVFFPETSHYVTDYHGFLSYWQDNGGLAIFGFPISDEVTDSNGLTVQYFERARFEWHEDIGMVELGLLGWNATSLDGVPSQELSATAPSPEPGARYFEETQHNVAEPFARFWESNGGLAIFGYPISEPFFRSSDHVLVQYFERARFELHWTDKGPVVMLGLIGREWMQVVTCSPQQFTVSNSEVNTFDGSTVILSWWESPLFQPIDGSQVRHYTLKPDSELFVSGNADGLRFTPGCESSIAYYYTPPSSIQEATPEEVAAANTTAD